MGLKLIQPFEHGLTWVMDEWMQRASHALVVDGEVWLIDPVDVPEAIEQAVQLGEIAGVIQLLDRHPRACHSLASHYDVPLHRLPKGPGALDGTPFQVIDVLDGKAWRERALWWPDTGTLVVAEQLGTNPYYALSGKSAVGVHPMMRALVKKRVGDHLPVQHLLVGHGAPVHQDAAVAIAAAYDGRLAHGLLLPKGLRAFFRATR
ncbi:MAG: hypothetical protein Q7T55_15590 [Solirubrobacteraceae bacterium]|nr:hypothetical protein [Solirubrobacteraceae bacterium]